MLRTAMVGVALAVTTIGHAQSTEWQFRCASPGTSVERTNGTRLMYRGQDTGNPLVCINDHGQRRFLGYWSVQENFFQRGEAQLARLLQSGSGQAGQEQTITYFGNDRYGVPNQVQETWRVAGSGRIQVPAGTFEAMQIEREFRVVGSTYRYVQTLWLDKASGVPLRVSVDHLNGFMNPVVTNWAATEVRSAPNPPSAATQTKDAGQRAMRP